MSNKIISISSSRSDLGLLSVLVRRILKEKAKYRFIDLWQSFR